MPRLAFSSGEREWRGRIRELRASERVAGGGSASGWGKIRGQGASPPFLGQNFVFLGFSQLDHLTGEPNDRHTHAAGLLFVCLRLSTRTVP